MYTLGFGYRSILPYIQTIVLQQNVIIVPVAIAHNIASCSDGSFHVAIASAGKLPVEISNIENTF